MSTFHTRGLVTMSEGGRFAYEPLLDLTDGRPAGVEVLRRRDRDRTALVAPRVVWGTRQIAEFDAGIAITSVLHDPSYDSTVPLHVDICADTVVAARPRIAQLPGVLRERLEGLPIPPIVLEIGPAVSAASPRAFAEGVTELRSAGFAIAFDGVGRGFGLDLVAELLPHSIKLDTELVARLGVDPAADAVVTAICDVARACGITVSAVGVTHRDELAALRDHGITRAQGPLLASAQQHPGVAGLAIPVALIPRIQAAREAAPLRTVLPSVASLAKPALVLPDHVTADVVRAAFASHPHANSVLLTDTARRPTGFLDRNRFLMTLSGPYGHALYARRRADSLAEPPRTVGPTTDLAAALEYCLADRSRSWDDLVLLDGSLCCAGIVRVDDLMHVATGMYTEAGSVA
jgi:EAL domain-containing protein (putative c-di-GMP-specific phosphodiesterase class I)